MMSDCEETNAGHTPGPWIVIPGWGHEKDTLRVLHIDSSEGNAHLIAAAPDLLAALVICYDALNKSIATDDGLAAMCLVSRVMDKHSLTDAALAKSKGGAA